MILRFSSLFLSLFFFATTSLFAASAPEPPFYVLLEGKIQDTNRTDLAKIKIYHEYVEIYSLENKLIGRVGILADEGFINIFVSGNDEKTTLYAYARMGIVYDLKDEWIASYSITPTYTYVFNDQGDRLGRVKCLAWQRVCGLAATAYLLKFFEPKEEVSP